MEKVISNMSNTEIINYLGSIRGTFVVNYFSRRTLYLIKKIDMNDDEWISFLIFCNKNKEYWGIDEFYLNEWRYHKKNKPNSSI